MFEVFFRERRGYFVYCEAILPKVPGTLPDKKNAFRISPRNAYNIIIKQC